ncbi:hypothetical protein OS493_006964 [Desmophyllum pertusum]|uniref:Uncharacterized protein n=1 Tax=Desmophyllum pertusum TaxID=174260 RepID=A0A9W9ZGL0_9CNID|nr:hypothetical protein OS493_006964 [Desmophyllum pertusum]
MQNWPTELQQLVGNLENEHNSKQCLLCMKTNSSTCLSSREECSISECWLSLGGNWEFIAMLLDLTAPNGTFFCNLCHARINDLEKGKPHTPWLLQNGSTVDPKKQFPVGSFESILSDNESFVKGGAVKSNQFHNCECSTIFQAAGPVFESVSCMPLHLSLGLGKQALELVENEAISLDNTIKEAI